MQSVTIIGVGTHLPGKPIDNKKIQEKFNVNAEWIDLVIGNETRHLVMDLDTGEVNSTLADICALASAQALDKAQIDPEEIDFVVMGTATPDHLMPATVNFVCEKLGINNVPTYQLQSGCAGAMQALDIGTVLLRSGQYTTGLIIGGDVCAKYIDLSQDFSGLSSSELINYALFGDGAGAAVLTNEDSEGMEILHTLNRCEGLNREPGQELNWLGSAAIKYDDVQPLREEYKAIETEVPRMARETTTELLAKAGWDENNVDYFMTPQLAGLMTDKIIDYMALPHEKSVNCVAVSGNNGNALPFLQLKMLSEKLQKGQTAIGVAIESSKWIKGGIVLQGV
ncbi:3-oxoacyl-ACP synthase III family protein [Teredinibacter purpureus]|uniref:3-oxoacyl-ACP synthase III family protein n=1 Tax=Teredinibacter purpureus TaxID=2731756 RepID=UPI0005F77A99|nr:3-oxoacyl-ACP synthase III family protein [Teredinibacter purpureus]